MPPREPNGRSSLCRSSCSTCSGISNRSRLGCAGGRPGRQARDLASHRHVSLQMSRRNRERVREIVETAVGRVIARQQRLHVHIEREQIANRVVVFRAIQTMDRADSARIRIRQPTPGRSHFRASLAISAIRRRIGARHSRRRHGAGAQLRDHLLQHFGIGGRLGRDPPCRARARQCGVSGCGR